MGRSEDQRPVSLRGCSVGDDRGSVPAERLFPERSSWKVWRKMEAKEALSGADQDHG